MVRRREGPEGLAGRRGKTVVRFGSRTAWLVFRRNGRPNASVSVLAKSLAKGLTKGTPSWR
jgi:hypothetical protein